MKKTKRDYYNEILAIEGLSDELKTFVKGEVALLDKKNTNRKPTKAQTENEKYKTEILSVLRDAESALTASEIRKSSEVLTSAGEVQKVSALLVQLVKTGEVVKNVDGRKSTFTLPTVETADTVD